MTAEPSKSIQVRPLEESNLPAVQDFIASALQRTESTAFQHWRYQDCPSMEGSVAMVGDECVATMFALRRSYQTPDGPREWLEPFEWHSNEDWRAQAPGLRIVRHYMKGSRPLIAVPGTDAAGGLLERLRWHHVGTLERYALPLSGRYLRSRGRGALLGRTFDVVGRPLLMPSTPRKRGISVAPASTYASGVTGIVAAQRRFALMRRPDDAVARWLQRAPATVGNFTILHARRGDDLVGWAVTRVFTCDDLRVGELLEVFLADDAREFYPDLVAAACGALAGYRPDLMLATTTCPDTAAALRRLRFRFDTKRPVLVWWGGTAPIDGPILVDGTFADHTFFPRPSGADAAWLE